MVAQYSEGYWEYYMLRDVFFLKYSANVRTLILSCDVLEDDRTR